MSQNANATWHRKSYERLLQHQLPGLLAERLPLVGYHTDTADPYTARVRVIMASTTNGDIELDFPNVPQPDKDGLFRIEGEPG